MRLRSILFIPALAERFIAKAAERGADQLVIDLEDSIAPARKADARAALPGVAARLAPSGIPLMVRINHLPGGGAAALVASDIGAAVRAEITGLMLPKIETAAEVQACADLVAAAEAACGLADGHTWLMPMLETPRGVLNTDSIARAHPRVKVLNFGVEDFAQAMRTPPSAAATAMPAQMVAMAGRANGIPTIGLPGSVAEFTDLAAFRRTVELARELGLVGSGCIHPAQVAILNEVFGANTAAIAEAQAIVTLYEAALARGEGAVAHEGRMIDIPVYERALALLRDHGDAGR
jgi:citrate lyase subunit beta/citryl-CoA lyase